MRKQFQQLGFDLDDTIIDHEPHRQKLFGERRAGKIDFSRFTHEELKALKRRLYGELSLEAPPMQHAVETLQHIADTGISIFIVSKRDISSQDIAHMWIKKHMPFFQLDLVHFVTTDEEKGVVCERLNIDLFMDDHIQVLEALPQKTLPILFDKYNQSTSSVFSQISAWDEFLDMYKKLAL